MSLQDFLGVNGSETKPGVVQVTKAIATSWADEPEEDDDRPLQTFSLPTAPRSSRALDDVPELPPYIAHLSNLPFDVEDEDIYDLFDELEVEKLRVPREDGGERSRGFGYIEFKKRNDLIAALTMPDPHIRNRRLRIDISTEADQKRGGRGRYDGDSSNWRHNEGGSSRDDENGSGRRNYTSFGATRDWSSNADEEGGNWRDSLKAKSSPPPVRRSNYGDRDGGDRGGGYDRGDRDRGDRGSDRPLTRSNITESDRPLTRSNITENDRPLTRSNISENDRPMTRSNIDNDAVVAERPKLNLQKRTLPLPEIIVAVDVDAKETETEEPPKRAEPKSVPAADIFGEAKPVDTAARDRAVEERLERERLAIVEAAEKARLEREAAKAEAAAAATAAENVVDSAELNGDVEKVVEAPVVNSWRRKDDAPTNGNEEAPRTQSPARRRFSPDRRGGSRRTGKSLLHMRHGASSVPYSITISFVCAAQMTDGTTSVTTTGAATTSARSREAKTTIEITGLC